MEKGFLVLSTGEIFEGQRFGAAGDVIGELVFNTDMIAYPDLLTDSAAWGQLVVQTYPLTGNYGINSEDVLSANGAAGFIVREWCDAPSNFRCETDLDAFLKARGIPGLCGIDTRQVTRLIREHGALTAAIVSEVPADLSGLERYAVRQAVQAVTCDKITVYPAEKAAYQVTAIDFGIRKDHIKKLQALGCSVTVVPADTAPETILEDGANGVFLSSGPGDPAEETAAVKTVAALLGELPIFGVGLGHQILALAAGGQTERQSAGHRGTNQPVRDLWGSRTLITTQNHGYTVKADSVQDAQVRYVNVNDGTCEGLEYPRLHAFSVQFYPNLSLTPGDANCLFSRFVRQMGGNF